MKVCTCLVLLASLICLVTSVPVEEKRERRSPLPVRAVMVRGYLMRSEASDNGYHYNRPATSFNPGSSAAAGAFYGPHCRNCNQETPAQGTEATPQVDEEPLDEETPPAPQEAPVEPASPVEEPIPEVKTERIPKAPRKPKAPKAPKPTLQHPAEEDENDDDVNIGSPVYKNFFPMMFGSPSGGRRRNTGNEDEDQNPGGATAIANSFSTGKGAIANAKATAFGGVDPSQGRQSLRSRYRS